VSYVVVEWQRQRINAGARETLWIYDVARTSHGEGVHTITAKKRGTRERLDVLLVERERVDSRQQAQRLIMAGQVRVDGRVVDKPGTRVPQEADITLQETLPYVSRGGLKLEAALDRFAIKVTGVIAADVGASTGGFTDCLLQRGASKVYAIDVGYGQLAWRLRNDPRVVVMERANVRYLQGLPEPVDLAAVDVSFISLELVLPAIIGFLRPGGHIVALIKPQFEAGRGQVGKGGVVKDPEVHRAVLRKVLLWAEEHGLAVRGLMASPLKGPAGNVEFLAHLVYQEPGDSRVDIEVVVNHCLGELERG
jgi:23S rRNA (cytidine1920-2'-O)/16S rRNA (cytidine1409-2'-O)-methyltransferase